VPRSRFVGCCIALHASAKAFPVGRNVLLDLHVRIAEPDDDNLASRILDVHRALLPLARSVERLVERHLTTLVGVTFFGEGGFHRSRSSLII